VTLKLGTLLPPQAPFVQQGLQGWINAVTADSNGTLKIDLFAGGSLVKHPDQQLKMVLDNVAQISFFPNNTVPGRFPDDSVFELPLGPRNAAEASIAAWRLYEQGRLRGYEGMKVLAFLANGPAILQTTFPVTGTADLRDRKLRASTDAQVEMIKAIGGNPIGGIPVTGLAEGMSRGLVEGSITSWSAWAAFRMDRIATHHLEVPMGYSILPLVMNESAWATLPAAAKAAIEKHSYLAGSKRFGEIDAAITEAIRTKGLERDGSRTHKLEGAQEAAVRTALEGVVARWRKSHPKGEALHDALLQASRNAGGR
jgi:TRAP-type C4-dicarboxylate transport system substrate-binding protein